MARGERLLLGRAAREPAVGAPAQLAGRALRRGGDALAKLFRRSLPRSIHPCRRLERIDLSRPCAPAARYSSGAGRRARCVAASSGTTRLIAPAGAVTRRGSASSRCGRRSPCSRPFPGTKGSRRIDLRATSRSWARPVGTGLLRTRREPRTPRDDARPRFHHCVRLRHPALAPGPRALAKARRRRISPRGARPLGRAPGRDEPRSAGEGGRLRRR